MKYAPIIVRIESKRAKPNTRILCGPVFGFPNIFAKGHHIYYVYIFFLSLHLFLVSTSFSQHEEYK